MYEDGRIWTDLIGVGDEIANRLSKELKNIGVALEKTKQWQFWRRDNRLLNLHDEDPVDIAKCVVTAYLAQTLQIAPTYLTKIEPLKITYTVNIYVELTDL